MEMNVNKNVRDNAGREGPAMRGRSPISPTTMWYVTLAGLAVLLFLGFQNWAGARRIEQSLNDRLGQLDTRITQLSAKIDAIRSAGTDRRGHGVGGRVEDEVGGCYDCNRRPGYPFAAARLADHGVGRQHVERVIGGAIGVNRKRS